MNLVSSPLTPIQLNWVKSKIKGRQELIANGSILGSLQREGFWKPVSYAEFKGKMWSFRRNGCTRTEILEEPEARPVAEFKTNWLGGGTLSFDDGQRFQLVSTGFWRPVWCWLNDQGKTLLEVAPHKKSVSIIDAVDTGNWHSSQSRLPLLIMFSWHQILKNNDDAAAVAVFAATG